MLTGKEQEFFAELCSVMRNWWYDICKNNYAPTMTGHILIANGIQNLLMKYEYTPQHLDRFYDLMHRTGANT